MHAPRLSVRTRSFSGMERKRLFVAAWYVVQVRAGREEQALSLIRQRAGGDALKECFTPRYRVQQKVRGEWREVERKLIPGYLMAISPSPERLEGVLRGLPVFARLLRNEEGFIPLDKDEVAWIEAFACGRERVVPLSAAVKEGDEVIVTEGPLREHAVRIKRIDRRRSTAYIEVTFLGRVKEVPVGLKIVAKRNA